MDAAERKVKERIFACNIPTGKEHKTIISNQFINCEHLCKIKFLRKENILEVKILTSLTLF